MPKKVAEKKIWNDVDLMYAFENAAEFLENEEYPHDSGQQEAANKEAAKRIRQMAMRITKKN